MKGLNENELQFIAKHYKEGRIDTEKKLKQFRKMTDHTSIMSKRLLVAASVSAVFVLVFASFLLVNYGKENFASHNSELSGDTIHEKKADSTIVFHFENEPINSALSKLSSYYNCKLTANDTTKYVSGDIQAESLETAIEALEQTLDIKICK